MKNNVGIKTLTPEQFVRRIYDTKLMLEAAELEIQRELGQFYVKKFKEPFETKSFNGRPWPAARRPKPHPLMIETGTLRDSIKAEYQAPMLVISTNEVCKDPKRSSSYAAFHNDPMLIPQQKLSGHGRNLHRQFMGNSRTNEQEAVRLITNILTRRIR